MNMMLNKILAGRSGYLIGFVSSFGLVGLALGPHTFGLLPDSEANREFAEFGIVFLMFSIGLEFSLPQLYAMRKKVQGQGVEQVCIVGTQRS